MKPSERYMYHRLAEALVTPARYALQGTIAFEPIRLVEPPQDCLPFYATEQPEPPEAA